MPRRKKNVITEETNESVGVVTDSVEVADAETPKEPTADSVEPVEVERPVRRRKRRRVVELPQTIDLSEFVTAAATALAPKHVTETEIQLFKVGFSNIPANSSVGRYSPYLPLLIGGVGVISILLKLLNERRQKQADKKDTNTTPTVAEFWR